MLNLRWAHLPVIRWKADTWRDISWGTEQNPWSNEQENRETVRILGGTVGGDLTPSQKEEVGRWGRRLVRRGHCQTLPMIHLRLKTEAYVSRSSLIVNKLEQHLETTDLVPAAHFPTYCCCFDPLQGDKCRFSFIWVFAIQSLIPASSWTRWGSWSHFTSFWRSLLEQFWAEKKKSRFGYLGNELHPEKIKGQSSSDILLLDLVFVQPWKNQQNVIILIPFKLINMYLKFHENPFIAFQVTLLANKQTERYTLANT